MKDFISKIKNKFKFVKKIYKKNINPHKYWEVLLSVFFILILGLISFSLYLSYQIKNDKIFKTEEAVKIDQELLNEKLFTKVMEEFNNKNIKLEELKNSTQIFSDPS